jgi:hypothetical protein
MGKVYDRTEQTLLNYGNEDDMTLDLARQVDELTDKLVGTEITTPLQAFQEFHRLVNKEFEESGLKDKSDFTCWDTEGGQRVFQIADEWRTCTLSFDIASGIFVWHDIDPGDY